MPDVIFEEIECKTALSRVAVANMPFRWSLNPYRGCQHACTYCFARGTHEHLGFDAGRDFESRIIVKVNLPEVLRHDLTRPGWRRELVAIGTSCDDSTRIVPVTMISSRPEVAAGVAAGGAGCCCACAAPASASAMAAAMRLPDRTLRWICMFLDPCGW